MSRKALPIFAAILLAAIGVAWLATRASVTRVDRAALVQAPREAVAARLADIRSWGSWPAHERRIPAQRRFGGPAAGAGSSVYWSDADDAGRLTVIAATAATVEVELEALRPRSMSADLSFRLAAQGGGTRVEASATIERDLLGRVLSALRRRDPLVADLDAALSLVKAAAEADQRLDRHVVERAASIAAAPAAVRAELADPRHWATWSPWAGAGPQVRRSAGGPASGAGASLYWSVPDGASGRVTILAAGADRLEAEIETPAGAVPSRDVAVALAPDGEGTRVTWIATFERDPDHPAPAGADAATAAELERALSGLAAAVAVRTASGAASSGDDPRPRRRVLVDARDVRRAPAHTGTP